jgi:hypothetical protein
MGRSDNGRSFLRVELRPSDDPQATFGGDRKPGRSVRLQLSGSANSQVETNRVEVALKLVGQAVE